ncbi:MAG: hypothetical protein RLZZ244_2330 [Verrucomicrobiota bacterium]|jgi:adenylate cyclase
MLGANKKTVLIVDDAPENITVLKEVLAGLYRIRVATSGERALEICREESKPDLVLLDVMMPGLDGYAVCRSLKRDPSTSHVPVIFITALKELRDEERGLAVGAVDYITKPINAAIVRQRVRTHLELQSKRQALEDLSRKYALYLSPELAEEIRRGNNQATVSASRKEITVFFSDLEGFTKKAEAMSPEDLGFALNHYFQSMARIVARHHGTLDKYIGDAVMVFFGDPISRGVKEDAVACVEMALEMQREMAQVEAEWRWRGIEETLRVRMGIATGPCAVGNFGSAEQLTYTILGNTVNLAARLESVGEPGSVVVSESTWRLVSERFEGRALEPVQLKGFSEPMRAYAVAAGGVGCG